MTLDRLSDASWRVRLCTSQPGLAYLTVNDHRSAVTLEGLDSAIAIARSLGATRVRTSALFDEAAPALDEAGFGDIDRLVLLRRDLDPKGPVDPRLVGATNTAEREPVRLHRFGRHCLPAAARVDAAAFGPLFTMDPSGLAEALSAMPTSWGRYASAGRWSRGRRGMVGFVLCGASGADAYIHRLAVNPLVHRQRIASALMRSSLEWMSNRGSTSVLVNTRPDNAAALALYERWGFSRLRQQLIVAERALS